MKYSGLSNLNLAELESMYRIIDDGIYDGRSTDNIECQAYSADYGHEKDEKKLKKRSALLKEIQEEIRKKINDVLSA
jgi:endo-alpha-1,4-polygalactosaminidase (GH114 family)